MRVLSEPKYRSPADLPLDALRVALEGKVEIAVLFGSVASGQTHGHRLRS